MSAFCKCYPRSCGCMPDENDYPTLEPDQIMLALQRWEDLQRSVERNDVAKAMWAEAWAYELFATLNQYGNALKSAESILWMAERYAEAGGTHSIELEEYEAAKQEVRRALKS